MSIRFLGRGVLGLFVGLAFSGAGWALEGGDRIEPIVVGHSTVLSSSILGEDRPLVISTPAGAADSGDRFPVVYLLDGPGHLLHTAGTIQHLSRTGFLPPMIVIGIGNTDRMRDLTPTAVEGRPSGGGGKLLEFMEKELIPWVESRYSTSPYRVFVGHSLGGLMVVHSLLNEPDMFQAYLAISPSLWWDERKLLGAATEGLSRRDDWKSTQFFFTMGDEGGAMQAGTDELDALLNRVSPSGLAWDYRVYPDETHGSVPLKSTYDGLRFIFEDWRLDPAKLSEISLDGLRSHYEKLSGRMGFEILAPENLVNQLGYRHLGADQTETAIAVFRWNAEAYPDSANVYDSLGEALERGGKIEEALGMYEKASALAERGSHPNLGVYQANRDRLREESNPEGEKKRTAREF